MKFVLMNKNIIGILIINYLFVSVKEWFGIKRDHSPFPECFPKELIA